MISQKWDRKEVALGESFSVFNVLHERIAKNPFFFYYILLQAYMYSRAS